MKIDFNQFILNLKDEPIKDGGEDLTLGTVCTAALLNADFRESDAKEKFSRGSLALKISDTEGPINLKAEEITLLKELVGKVWNPLIIARAFPMLDSAEG